MEVTYLQVESSNWFESLAQERRRGEEECIGATKQTIASRN